MKWPTRVGGGGAVGMESGEFVLAVHCNFTMYYDIVVQNEIGYLAYYGDALADR